MTHEESGSTCACGGNCSCQSSGQQHEVAYLTREQYIMKLEEYLVDLKAEIEAVEIELNELKSPVLMANG
jgi:hypothetical protein